ncbi:MAG: hypothetical protein DMF61_10835 [Blastocatellia bacterium AA13]|nr:MAG: hypothetical protein DMF61_10835 [Blastocatellia bacterium AA13]
MTTLRQRQTSSIILLLISLLLSCCAIALASQSKQEQVPAPPLPEDPTPLIELVTEAERASLAKAHEPKKAVEALLAIADAHLALALPAIQADDYKKSERELDIYRKAIGEAASTAFSSEEGKRKLAKKVEMKLHDHIRVLEQIDLRFPLEREAFAAAALDQAKHLRIKMLNEAFASDVLKDSPEGDQPSVKKKGSGFYFIQPARSLSRTQLLSGDYLTEGEDNHVREAQQIDARVRVFVKIADRRLSALSGKLPETTDKKEIKRREEETREWGALPTLSRLELLTHYRRAIEEGMAKLEDAYERNPKASTIPRALQHLKESTERQLQTLKSLQVDTEAEKGALSRAISAAETALDGVKDALKPK